MPTYLVRLIDNLDLVGIFVARNVDVLAIAVDECTDPWDCEYIVLGVGGIMWTSPAIPIPIELPEELDGSETDPMPWGAATMTDSWWDYFHGFTKLRWKPIFPDRTPDPLPPEPPEKPGPGHVVPFKKRR
jgi:hypothetical protein